MTYEADWVQLDKAWRALIEQDTSTYDEWEVQVNNIIDAGSQACDGDAERFVGILIDLALYAARYRDSNDTVAVG